MLKEVAPGFSRKVSLPVYGLQDRGIAPGGAAALDPISVGFSGGEPQHGGSGL